MMHERLFSMPWSRALAQVAIVALGLVSLVGSGGGEIDFPPATPMVDPRARTSQVGGTVVFRVDSPDFGNPTYQWLRAPRGGSFAAIPGATSAAYTVAGANLLDDGSVFMVDVSGRFDGRQWTLSSTEGRLAVSSMPPVVIQDSEFLAGDWSVDARVEPASNGPTHGEEQVATGGNPGAYRRTAISMPAGPSLLYVFNLFGPATYDPATQGALYVVEFTQDCLALPGTLAVEPRLLVEQNGRRYSAGAPTLCGSGTWSNYSPIAGHFGVANFVMVDGAPCGVGEACPDFSSSGQPIRFGFANRNQALAGLAGASGGFGIDNWNVTAWRR
jgi:hypothetical protein